MPQEPIFMEGGTALTPEPAVVLDEPFCEQCGIEMPADHTTWVVVELDTDDLPQPVRPSDYGYCSKRCARKDGAI